jgi:hypothetical protein
MGFNLGKYNLGGGGGGPALHLEETLWEEENQEDERKWKDKTHAKKGEI